MVKWATTGRNNHNRSGNGVQNNYSVYMVMNDSGYKGGGTNVNGRGKVINHRNSVTK